MKYYYRVAYIVEGEKKRLTIESDEKLAENILLTQVVDEFPDIEIIDDIIKIEEVKPGKGGEFNFVREVYPFE